MSYNVLIFGASYGSLFGTKLLMAGHRVTLVCTRDTADLINREGTIVRMPIKGCLVRRIAKQQGQQSETLDEIVGFVDERLAKNRSAAKTVRV